MYQKYCEGCVEKPLLTLWNNYQGSGKPDVQMKMTITQSGLKAVTKEHGLTEYWSHRVTYCSAPAAYPRVFCWVYRHEGRRLKQELRPPLERSKSAPKLMSIEESVEEEVDSDYGSGGKSTGVGGNCGAAIRRRGLFRRSGTIGEIRMTAMAEGRTRECFRRATTFDEPNRLSSTETESTNTLSTETLSESAEARVTESSDGGSIDDDRLPQAFNSLISFSGIVDDEDPFSVGVHIPGDFDSPPASLLEK
ncbi:unnamed protein product, partial [Nesidiocoris tenuis]